mmetsp:Transcript_15200/g.43460  ORF Transcript_15200/g.43460 Transcript_15200/m.43460 type:complete len:237 (+) Transcript_15200:261-971(+)
MKLSAGSVHMQTSFVCMKRLPCRWQRPKPWPPRGYMASCVRLRPGCKSWWSTSILSKVTHLSSAAAMIMVSGTKLMSYMGANSFVTTSAGNAGYKRMLKFGRSWLASYASPKALNCTFAAEARSASFPPLLAAKRPTREAFRCRESAFARTILIASCVSISCAQAAHAPPGVRYFSRKALTPRELSHLAASTPSVSQLTSASPPLGTTTTAASVRFGWLMGTTKGVRVGSVTLPTM